MIQKLKNELWWNFLEKYGVSQTARETTRWASEKWYFSPQNGNTV